MYGSMLSDGENWMLDRSAKTTRMLKTKSEFVLLSLHVEEHKIKDDDMRATSIITANAEVFFSIF